MELFSIIMFIVLFGLSAFFSGSEIAFMSLASHKINALTKLPGGKTLKKLKSNNERLLITILIGNNLVNVFTASFATKISIQIAENSGSEQSIAIGISTGVITLLLLLFGEIFPKTYATKYAEKISLGVAKIYLLLEYLLYPVIILIESLMKLLNKGKYKNNMTNEEIESFIDMGKESGAINKSNYKKIKSILKFEEITCEMIMTPRIKIEAISKKLSVDQAIDEILNFSHSRVPVYNKSIDDSDHIVSLRDLIKEKQKGNGGKILSEINLTKAIKVPMNQSIGKLFEIFKNNCKQIALLIDEYGGVDGLITLEDIIEEVFGDFIDETDKEELPITKYKNGYIVQPEVIVNHVLELYDLKIENLDIDPIEYDQENINYFITSFLQRFPRAGEQIKLKIINNEEKNKNEQNKNIFEINIIKIEKNKIGSIFVRIL